MAPKPKEAGGGAATGLANDFIGGLKSFLDAGKFGGPGAAADTGMYGVLNDLLSGGAGKIGGALGKMLEQRQNTDIANIRARYGAQGGMSFGTPAAYGEAAYRAQAAPQATMAIGNLQLQALEPLMNIIAGMSGKGISQRQTYLQENPFVTAAGALGGLAQGAGSLMTGIGAV